MEGDSDHSVNIEYFERELKEHSIKRGKQPTRPIIRRVPQTLRQREKVGENNYDPKAIALGPYHHQKEDKLVFGRDLKYDILKKYHKGCNTNVSGLYRKVLGMVNYLRSFYEEGSTEEYEDEKFAEMMLLDGCFILHSIEGMSTLEGAYKISRDLMGLPGAESFARDMVLLENQVPFAVLLALMRFKHDKEKWQCIFNMSFSSMLSGNYKPQESRITFETFDQGEDAPERSDQEPLCLLEIFYYFYKCYLPCYDSVGLGFDFNQYQTKSATELKAKGIYVSPNTSKFKMCTEIEFQSHLLHAHIKVRPCILNMNIKPHLLNMLAYEVCTYAPNEPHYVAAYVSFMRSLMQTAEDVKELKSKGIILNILASDEDVLQMFNEMDINAADDIMLHWGVLRRIEEHISNKGKTWIAELRFKYVSSPWTFIAVLASTILLILTFLQTYYTIHSQPGK